MEALDPLEFLDDIEVALPEVVCGWQAASETPRTSTDTDVDTEATSLLLLPSVLAPSPRKADDVTGAAGGKSSPTSRRRKYSAVASFFQPRRAVADELPLDETATPPILAALASVSLCPDRHGPRDLDTFRFGAAATTSASVSPVSTSPPSPDGAPALRPRGRIQSAIAFSSPLDLRTPTPASPVSLDPVSSRASASGSASGSATPPSPRRQRHSTSTSSHRSPYALASLTLAASDEGLSTCAALDTDGNTDTGSCTDHHEEPRMMDPNVTIAVGVGSSKSGSGTDRPLPGTGQATTPRNSPPRLPPIAFTPSSPHKPLSPVTATTATNTVTATTCVACGLALDPATPPLLLLLDAADAVHRACFRCAHCHEPLTLANFHRLPPSPRSSHTQPQPQRFACTTHHVARLLEAKLPSSSDARLLQ